jgi:ketosteroid isomerase-like protein
MVKIAPAGAGAVTPVAVAQGECMGIDDNTGIEDNKRTVLAWLAAVNNADEQAILETLSDDFVFKYMARRPEWLAYHWNKQEFARAPLAQSTVLEDRIHMDVVSVVAEGNRVVLEMQTDAMLRNGKRYDNAYSLIFEVENGKVTEAREYSCSNLVVECFGEFNPNNPQASKAAVGA